MMFVVSWLGRIKCILPANPVGPAALTASLSLMQVPETLPQEVLTKVGLICSGHDSALLLCTIWEPCCTMKAQTAASPAACCQPGMGDCFA